jgi:uncharacterized protein (TIGR02996 family)
MAKKRGGIREKKVRIPTAEDEPFLRDILANPDDDAPRLRYADWLDENGQPARAELIRLQVRLARMPAHHPERPPLAAREQQILDEYQEAWASPLRKAGPRWRGFIAG